MSEEHDQVEVPENAIRDDPIAFGLTAPQLGLAGAAAAVAFVRAGLLRAMRRSAAASECPVAIAPRSAIGVRETIQEAHGRLSGS